MTEFIETTEKNLESQILSKTKIRKYVLHEEKTQKHNEKTVTALSIVKILYS